MSRRPASGGGPGGGQRCGVRDQGRELQAWVWGTSGERRSGFIRTGPRTGKGRKEGGRGTGERDKETSGEHVHVGSPPFPRRLPITPLLAGSGRRASPPPLALRSRLWGLDGWAAVRGIWGRHRRRGVAASRGGRPGRPHAAIYISGPRWPPSEEEDSAVAATTVTAYFGVLHSGGVRSCLPRL